jgi:hypothetical protein
MRQRFTSMDFSQKEGRGLGREEEEVQEGR